MRSIEDMAIQIFRQADEILTLAEAARKEGRRPVESDLSILKNASMVVEDGRLKWIGPHAQLPKSFARAKGKEISLKGLTVAPAFVECHTHTVFAGERAEEFEWRNQGVSYQEIAARGGGILSTMKHTRKATAAQLQALAQTRVDAFVRQGVTTLEIKSGYGLDEASEIKCLRAMEGLKGPRIVRTFLGAHALPPEFATHDEYLTHLETKVLPKIRKNGWAERVDIFVEKGFFSADRSRRFLAIAREMGFEITVHADQLSLSGGTRLALDVAASSADHVIQLGDEEIKALASSSTVAVLLPAADLYMKCPYPPARGLIDSGGRVALATDFNPGTCPTQDLSLVGLLARLEMKMSLPEVLVGYTLNPAVALGRASSLGSLEVGKSADFVCTDHSWTEFFYSVGAMNVTTVYREGRPLWKKPLGKF